LPAQQQPKASPPIVQFRQYVEQRMATLEDALPPTISPKRFVSVVMTALQNKPKLLECTFQSLWNACVRAAQDGLLPDGREGAIAPYGENKDGKRVAEIATWMPMVEGYRKKIFETGQVKSWQVQVVRERDDFEYELGDNAFIKHKPFIGKESPGGIVGAYSIAKLTSGETVYEVMGAFDIMQIASKSKAGNGPWKDAVFVPEMARKVVARRHYKQLPHSESMDAMIARDDQTHGLLDPADTPAIAAPVTRRLTPREEFDAYAGTTIDHDETTGEVFDDQVSDQDRSDFDQEASAASSPTGGASKGADTASPGPQRAQSAPSKNTDAAPTEGSGGGAAAKEAGEQGTTAPASTGGGADAASPPTNSAGDELDAQEDGADRPWPPGAEPTNEAEYGRYLRTKLETITEATKVARWFTSPEENELRKKCNVTTRFNEFKDAAIARRNELDKVKK
jgi:recombination protein RecT